jgi:hypothetical protein
MPWNETYYPRAMGNLPVEVRLKAIEIANALLEQGYDEWKAIRIAIAKGKGHVERLIGSIRRESLDHLIVFGEPHLRRILKTYASYYNEVRTHPSLNKDASSFRRVRTVGNLVALPWLGGLHHQYLRV